MKNYLAFYGPVYYPSRAMGNLIGDFDTLKEAIAEIEKNYIEEDKEEWDYYWGSVWDFGGRCYVWNK